MKCKKYTFKELATIKYGKNQAKVLSATGSVPIYGTGGIMGYASTFLYDKASVLIGRKGSIGKVKYVEHPFWTVDTLFYTEINQELVLPRFLYYLLSQYDFNQYNEGTTIPSLRTETLNRLEYSIPPLPTQRKITAILTSLDDKIENNSAICKNLEEQAAALYKSWFVDFEPFGGVMPDGWKYNTLSHMSNIKSGKRPIVQKKLKSNSETVPVLGASGVNGYSPLAMYEHPVLVTGRVGTHGVIQRWKSPCWPSDNTLVIETHNYEYVYQVLDNIDYSILNRGSTQPLITQHDLGNVSIVVPSSQWLQKYEKRAGELMNLSDVLLKENEVLATLRDTILPKLMSGEINVDTVCAH